MKGWMNWEIGIDIYTLFNNTLKRKAMTNIDSILKNRDFAFPKKVRLVKAIVFTVVTYGCESWAIKKAQY